MKLVGGSVTASDDEGANGNGSAGERTKAAAESSPQQGRQDRILRHVAKFPKDKVDCLDPVNRHRGVQPKEKRHEKTGSVFGR